MKVTFDSIPFVKFGIFFVLVGPCVIQVMMFWKKMSLASGLFAALYIVIEFWLAFSAFKGLLGRIKSTKED